MADDLDIGIRFGPLYIGTPDGWLASDAVPGAPPDCYYADSPELRNADPE